FTCAQVLPPRCLVQADQPSGAAGTPFNVFCSVFPGTEPVSTGLAVSLNATGMGGGVVPLHDDGLPPDAVANDNIFSGTIASAPGAALGNYSLMSTVSDAQGRQSACDTPYSVIVPASNDECANPLPAFLGNNPFDNTNASTSAPPATCGLLGRDLWY